MLKVIGITFYVAMILDLLNHYRKSDFKTDYGWANWPIRFGALVACILWVIPVFLAGVHSFKNILSKKAEIPGL